MLNIAFMEKTNIRRGIVFALISGFCFALMGIFVRASGDLPFYQKAVFRNSIAFLIAAVALASKAKSRGTREVLRVPKGALKFLILRSIFGTIGIFGNFYALGKINVSDANMLNKMSPFFSLLMSIFLLGEKPTALSVLSLFTAFTGALLVIKPSMDFYKMAPALAGLAGGNGGRLCIRKRSQMPRIQSGGLPYNSLFFSLFRPCSPSCNNCLLPAHDYKAGYLPYRGRCFGSRRPDGDYGGVL